MRKGVKRWNNYNKRIFDYSPYLLDDDSDNSIIKLITQHYINVETFFSLHPESKFITYDIENDNIEKLEKYIDLRGTTLFPKENVNKII